MSRKVPSPIRLDILGLNPRVFDLCRANIQAVVGSRRGRSFTADESFFSNLSGELSQIPKDDLILYNNVVSIAIDFEKAYGRNIVVRILERSPNKFSNLFGKRKEEGPLKERVAFFVNGVKVYAGIPNSFSELDEAVEKALGRRGY